jgi:membrane protease YdiL (CAAX protease family)
MNDTSKAALIMTGVVAVQAPPLVFVATGRHGVAGLTRLLGWGAPPAGAAAWACAALVAAAYIASSMRSLPYIRRHALDATPLKAAAIPFAFVTGTFEELFFRQWLMDAALARGAGALTQMVASALAFGAVHAIWGLMGGSLVAAGKSMAYTGALGLALAGVYLLSGRQLAPAAWSHIAVNLAIEPWLLLAVMDLRKQAGRTQPMAPARVAGG